MSHQSTNLQMAIETQNGKFKTFDNVGVLNDRTMGPAEKLKAIDSHLGDVDEKVS